MPIAIGNFLRNISTPINVVDLDGDLTVISYRQRTWWRNLRDERPARLHYAGRTDPVRAEIVEETARVAAGLAGYFARYPAYTKYFDVQLAPDGKPDRAGLESAARDRVLIRLHPV